MLVNKDFRIKLIIPPWFEYYKDFFLIPPPFLPYGIGVLSAYLRKNGYYVEQEDLAIKFNHHKYDCYNFLKYQFKFNIDTYKEYIHDYIHRPYGVPGNHRAKLDLLIQKVLDSTAIDNFNLIGFSTSFFYQFLFATLLSKKIKERTNIPIVLGGFFITIYGHLYSSILDFVDYMVVGDGQVPLLKLIAHLEKRLPISEVPNLVFKYNGKIISNPMKNFPIEDTPIPDFNGLPIKLYKTNGFKKHIPLPYQITRGCASRCSFCVDINKDKELEFKSYEKVLGELKEMKKRYNCNQFIFSDLTINNSYEYINKLLELIIKNKLNIIWSSYLKIDKHLDKNLLEKMSKAGCVLLCFGLESGSDRILEMMNKGYTSELASKVLRDAHGLKIKTHINLLVGYPYETQQDINQTVGLIMKNRKYIYSVWVNQFSLLYGCDMYNNSESYKIINLHSLDFTPHIFSFDELNGLRWGQIRKRSALNHRIVSRSAYRNVLLKPKMEHLYNIFPYSLNLLYFYLLKKITSINKNVI